MPDKVITDDSQEQMYREINEQFSSLAFELPTGSLERHKLLQINTKFVELVDNYRLLLYNKLTNKGYII